MLKQLEINSAPSKHSASWLAREFKVGELLPDVTAGLIIGVLVIIFSISLASLIFVGPLAPFAPLGIGLTLLGALMIGLTLTLFGSLANTIAAPQEAPAAIMALIVADIVKAMPVEATPTQILVTALTAVALTTALTGLVFLLLGHYRLGKLIRFLPYPVVGGFLAGTGWLLLTGAIIVMTDVSPSLATLPHLLQPEVALRWLPGLLLAGLMLFMLNRSHHFLMLPAMLLGAVVLFYGVAGLFHTSPLELSAQGWLLQLPSQPISQSVAFADLAQVRWHVILAQLGGIAPLLVVSVVSLLLNASGLEAVVGRRLI